MELFDVIDETGKATGDIVSREEAHRKGVIHRSVHVWVIREKEGKTEVLLQKRSEEKESFPGMYDTSSAGHVSAGEEVLSSALRELSEELGITAVPEQLHDLGTVHIQYEKVFHGRLYRDNELAEVYVYSEPVEIVKLALQSSEVSEVRWFDQNEVWEEIKRGDRHRFCVPTEGLELLRDYIVRDPTPSR